GAFGMSLAWALVLASGCGGQSNDGQGNVSSEQASLSIMDCNTQASTCITSAKSPTDIGACRTAFQTCLMSVAGTPPTPPTPPGLPEAGLPPFPPPPQFPPF